MAEPRHDKNVGRYWAMWALACATGLLLGAMTAGAFAGSVMFAQAALQMGDSSQIAASSVAGMLSGAIYAMLIGASAMSVTLLGGNSFGGAAGATMVAMTTLAVAGLVIGVLQFDCLRRQRWVDGWWIAATGLGWALAGVTIGFMADRLVVLVTTPATAGLFGSVGFPAQADVHGYGFQLAAAGLIVGLAGGSGAGLLQCLVLRRRYARAGLWILVNAVGWGIGGMVAALVFTGVGLLLGGLLAGAVTGPILIWLVQQPLTQDYT